MRRILVSSLAQLALQVCVVSLKLNSGETGETRSAQSVSLSELKVGYYPASP